MLILIGVVLLVGVGIPVFFLAQNVSSPIVITEVHPTTVTVPFTKLTQGNQSIVVRRVNYVLKSPAELHELWRAVNAKGSPPDINFKTHTVIAVFAGQEASTAIAVAKIEDTNTRMVSIAIAKPNSPCAKKQSMVSPYEIVAVPATSLPLAHEDLSMTASCPK